MRGYLTGLLCLLLILTGCGGGGSGGGGNIGAGGMVPNVVGQTQEAATAAITGAGLTVGAVTTTSSLTVPVGDVISQNPTGGTSASAGKAVDLVISSGPGGGGGTFSLEEPFPNLPNFDNPVFFTAVPSPGTRFVVVEQTGRVRVFTPSASVSTSSVILDVSSLIVAGGEQGLLGLAFDPDFSTNNFIYVHYTRKGDGAIVVARYTWNPATPTANSPKIILTVAHSGASNHNGGMIAFGPDGYLYIALGDGGGGDDTFNNGQNLSSLLAKILRIDVHPADDQIAYLVPNDNPFVSMAPRRPETWAFGLRNPFRFSFDRDSGQLWVGDVGQNAWEEIDNATVGGGNFGWPRFEGNHLNPNRMDVQLVQGTQHTPPIKEYDHSLGSAIIGGYVYRGSTMPSLFGKYVYTDYGSGTVWAMDTNGQNNVVLTSAPNPTSFGEDNNGELYIVTQSGGLFRLTDGSGGDSQSTLLSQTGLFTDLANLTPASGLIEYDLNLPFWSDGAIKRRWVRIPQNAKVTFSPTGGWVFPNGTVIVKHFEMEMTEGDPNSRRRLETRLLIRDATGAWLGSTYKWNAAETDADLLFSGQSENLTVNLAGGGTITWPYRYPSRTDCLQCHNSAANFVLGLVTRQLNRDFDHGSVADNQLRSLNDINFFTTDIGAPTQYGAYPALDDTNAPVARRARAYLAVNCAQCHRPGGPTPVALDLRFDTADNAMGAIDVAPTGGILGLANARIIAPGNKTSSVLWERMRRLDGTRMPKLASHRVDQDAVDLIGVWIDSM